MARPYSPALGRFLAPDSIVPQPGNPQALNRYTFTLNNPLKYTDPTGHTPEWLNNAWSFIGGASAQYLDDITLGGWSALVVKMDFVDNEAYQQGREVGRTLSDAQAAIEIAAGAALAGAGAAGIAPTITIGAGCTALTGGACAAVAVPAVAVEAGMVVVGGAAAAHGAVMMARNAQQGPPSSASGLKHPTSQLPTGGQRRYVPPKQKGNPAFVKQGNGYVDADGNVWEWTKDPHGGPHWDVQHPNGQHTNIGPDGSVIGRDRFPNKPR